MEHLEILITAFIAAMVGLTEVLKALAARFAPKLVINPRLLAWISGVLVAVLALVSIKPESGGLLGALLLAFLASSGAYENGLKPIKSLIEMLKTLFTSKAPFSK